MNLGKWGGLIGRDVFRSDIPAFAGISGGRTSAMMASLLDPRIVLTFQNTGREHPHTLDFLAELEAALHRPIVWLEFRPPARKGAPPREFRFEIINYNTASRDGTPFAEMMQALADYRETKGEPPVSPWAKGRICTAYLKHRVQEHYIESLGLDSWDSYIGLRADEPARVYRIKDRETAAICYRCPLFDMGIEKPDVNGFWRAQAFDLKLIDRQGNCTGCFLKDQGDLSRTLIEPESDLDWWIALQARYRDFGGRGFLPYRQLADEYPVRMAIEAALQGGGVPTFTPYKDLTPRRFKLLVTQEKKRLAGEVEAFSCSCESSMAITDEDF